MNDETGGPSFKQTASKTHTQENFPVASWLIAPRHRSTILAFYRFARSADDIADSPALSPIEKLETLDAFEATLLGQSESIEAAVPLREALEEQNLSSRHPLDLLRAFRMDAVKSRYADWNELMHYCSYSAAPVGRFVLDVHGESEATWPASDAICSALQVINHLQDCGKDYAQIGRVYIPIDSLAEAGLDPSALSASNSSPALLAVLRELAGKTAGLVEQGKELPMQLKSLRLCLETSIIIKLAQTLTALLALHDPLSEKVHLSKLEMLGIACQAAIKGFRNFAKKPGKAAPYAAGGV
jgi:squalene synthase HpnC